MSTTERCIYEVLSTHLKTGMGGRTRILLNLTSNFMCLVTKARPAFLYDHSCISPSLSLKIRQDLSKSVAALKDIFIIEYSQDIMFAKMSTLLTHLQHSRIRFVDVGQSSPQFIDCSSYVDELVGLLQSWQSFHSDILKDVYELHSAVFISGPTVIGLLLGFPIVYFVTTETNCLSHTPLLITKCETMFCGNKFCVCSFSIPQCLLSTELHHALKKWIFSFESSLNCKVTQTIESFDCLVL